MQTHWWVFWQEPYYDPRSGLGYLAYRLKTVQRNSGNHCKGSSKLVYQDGPKTLREISSSGQLSGDECTNAISLMKHTTDTTVLKERMRATFKYRQNAIHDPETSLSILDYFPRFLDTPGLVRGVTVIMMIWWLRVYLSLTIFCL